MKANIFCRTTAKDTHSFFVNVEGETHFLFSQDYRLGVKHYFGKPVTIDRALDYSCAHGDHALMRTMEKLPAYIRYVEREYNVEVLRKTARKNSQKHSRIA